MNINVARRDLILTNMNIHKLYYYVVVDLLEMAVGSHSYAAYSMSSYIHIIRKLSVV